jgi:tetratricopeptide (TPR) repeat protein
MDKLASLLRARTTTGLLVAAALSAGCAASPAAARGPSSPAGSAARPAGPVVEVAPVVVSPYSQAELAFQFERARTLLLADRHREAAEAFDRIVRLAPDDPILTPPSLLNGGIAHEDLGERDAALERYRDLVRRFPAHETAKSAMQRAARVLAYLERWKDLATTATELAGRPDLSVLEAVEARGEKALGLIEQGNVDEASRAVMDARDLIEQNRLGEAGKPPLELAVVAFALGEVRKTKSEQITFSPLPASFADALEQRCQGLLDAQAAYSDAMRSLDAHWSAMAGYRVGQLYQQLHHDVMQIPPPGKADSLKKKQLFEGAMRLRYRVLLEKGLKMMEGTVRLGQRTGEASPWIARAEEAKRDLERALADEKAALGKLPFSEAELQTALDALAAKKP